ncbi:MAG: 16S rRNA processing protein RimM [Bacteroidaceae bacterium]|nr:16S rRNA processing protein RimM [Bacteroidaceae bacterium]
MVAATDTYKIGQLTRTHGVRGELAFRFTDDVWDRTEADYLFLELDGLLVPFFLEEWRFRSDDVALLKFEDIDTADQAQPLVGADVYFPKALTPDDVDEDELEWRHFIGFEVWQGEECLGTVADVLDQTANVLLLVDSPAGAELLIPAHEDFVLSADHRERRLYVNVPDEILTLNS